MRPLLPLTISALASAFVLQAASAATVVSIARDDTGTWTFGNGVPTYSSTDYLENMLPSYIDGALHSQSGPASVLTNGVAQSSSGDLPQSFFFSDAGNVSQVLNGRVVFDLGPSPVEISSINAYSWHSDSRAPQNFVIYGATGTEPNFDPTPAVADGSPTDLGYTIIATVNTTSLGLGGQQASHVFDDLGGSLGSYQYLLFDIFPTDSSQPDPGTTNTFFGEIDVNVVPEPASALLALCGGFAVLLQRRRRS